MKKISSLSRYRQEKGFSQIELAKKNACNTTVYKFMANRENYSQILPNENSF